MQSHSPGIRLALIGLLAIGTLAGLFATYKRFHVEAGNRRVELAVEWQEVNQLSQTSGKSIQEILAKFKAAHVSTVVIYEDTLGALEQTGVLKVEQKAGESASVTVNGISAFNRIANSMQIRGLIVKNATGGFAPKTIFRCPLNSRPKYLDSENQLTDEQLQELVRTPTQEFASNADYVTLKNMGIGLPPETVRLVRETGFRVAGRISNFPGTNEATAFSLLKQLKEAGASTIIFNGDEVLGYRGIEKAVASLLKPDVITGKNPIPDLSYGAVEFGKQKGDEKLSAALNGDYVRVHSIQTTEMAQLEEGGAVDRFVLAAKERNIRFCYIRLFTLAGNDPVEENVRFLNRISNGMASGSQKIGGAIGFGAAKRFEDPAVPKIVFAFIGLGTGAGLFWLLILLCPIPIRSQFAILIGCCILFVGLAFAGETGRKVAAFSAGTIFPAIACLELYPVNFISKKSFAGLLKSRRTVFGCAKISLYALMIASAITLQGIIEVVGLLASRPFMVHQEQFLGIKAQHAVPLLIVAIAAVAGGGSLKNESWVEWKTRWKSSWKAALDEPARFGMLILGIAGLAALALVVARTGNDAGVGVSGTELKIRSILDHFLPVRPRTKEFLVGHPAFFLGIAWWMRGRRRIAIPAIVIGSLGQVSLLNTFCHIHTPLLASLWRDWLGLFFGSIFGMILFLISERMLPAPKVEVEFCESGVDNDR